MSSLSNIVSLRKQLEATYQNTVNEFNLTRLRIQDYSALIIQWDARQAQATTAQSGVKDQEALNDLAALAVTAADYVQVYRSALGEAQTREGILRETLEKMSNTLYSLTSFENRHNLEKDLAKVSSDTQPADSALSANENREIAKMLYTAKALIELKEEQPKW